MAEAESTLCPHDGEDDPNFGARFVECSNCHVSTALIFPIKADVNGALSDMWNRRERSKQEISGFLTNEQTTIPLHNELIEPVRDETGDIIGIQITLLFTHDQITELPDVLIEHAHRVLDGAQNDR